jgi:hypothetical protein
MIYVTKTRNQLRQIRSICLMILNYFVEVILIEIFDTKKESNYRCYWQPMSMGLSLSLFGPPVLEESTHLGLKTKFLLLSDTCVFVDMGRSLWREDGPVVYNSYWSSPAQSFLRPSPEGLVTIFYCLTFEASLFFASYDSQGYGGGIRPRLHTGFSDG